METMFSSHFATTGIGDPGYRILRDTAEKAGSAIPTAGLRDRRSHLQQLCSVGGGENVEQLGGIADEIVGIGAGKGFGGVEPP